MTFWVAIAVLIALAALFVLVPLRRQPDSKPGDLAAENAMKAQLAELESETAAGLIDPQEAQAARAEIARRLFALESQRDMVRPAGSGRIAAAILVLAAVAVPAGAGGLYALLGTPSYPDQRMASRLQKPPGERDIQTLLVQVEKHLRDRPDDAKGWELIAPVYRRLGRGDDAIRAYSQALRHGSYEPAKEAAMLADLGELIVVRENGIVPDDAAAAFQRAAQLDKTSAKPRFFLAMRMDQDGERDAARAAWSDLIARFGQSNPPWLALAREKLAASGGGAPSAPGPDADQVAAAANMSDEDRASMIQGMVDGLAARLEESPNDIDGWLRLIRAYSVLKESGKASKALVRARDIFAGQTQSLKRINDLAEELKLEGTENG